MTRTQLKFNTIAVTALVAALFAAAPAFAKKPAASSEAGGAGSVNGQAISQTWPILFYVRDDARRGADEQFGGTSHTVRGDRPTHHARHEERDGATLE